MRFYDIGEDRERRLRDETEHVFPRIELCLDDGSTNFIPDSDILECEINSYREKAGGYVNCGLLVLDNRRSRYNSAEHPELKAGMQVFIHYAITDDSDSFHRFTLYVDNSGFQSVGDGTRKNTCTVKLIDYSSYLKATNEERDWMTEEKALDAEYCNKADPHNSLVHIIAGKAGLTENDIDCDTLKFTVPYVKFTLNVWEELCLLAEACKAHVECTKDKVLTFAYSPYDNDYTAETEASWKLDGDSITDYRIFERADEYKNTIRMKWTHYSRTDRVKLWSYNDEPKVFDSVNRRSVYPFGDGTRDIEKYDSYEAVYTVTDADGKTYAVVQADEVDDAETLEANISDSENCIEVLNYNTTAKPDRALIRLNAPHPTDLIRCEIWGKAVIAEQNFSNFIRNAAGVANYGTKAENITNKYMSDTAIDGIPFYERWGIDTLEEKSRFRKGMFIKTNQALFHARAGALISIDLVDSCGVYEEKAEILELVLRYRKDAAFETSLLLTT